MHAGLGQAQIVAPAEEGAPGAAGQQNRPGADDPTLGDDARDLAAFDVEAARRTILVKRSPELACGLGDGGSGQRRLGAAVGRRMDAADPLAGAAGRELLGLGAAQHPAVHLILACLEGPRLPLGEVVRAIRDIGEAGAAEAGLGAQFAGQLAPDLQALHGERQFAQVAMLLAAPAPVPAGLLAADHTLLEQRHTVTAFRQPIGGRTARDAAADHHDFGGGREFLVADDGLDGWGHRLPAG